MGHIINPVTTRLGLNIFWNSRWTLNNNYNYKYLFKKNIFFFQFINWFFQKKSLNKRNIIFSHYYLFLNSNNVLYINLNTLLKHWNYYITYTNTNIKKIQLSFINLTFNNINTHTILKYIKMRLISRYSLNYILKPILRDLHLRMRYNKILGYKILCAGRFTRKQIAAKMWFKQGAASVNNFESLIKYSQMKVRLKYGVCGVKIWINYGSLKQGRATQKLDLSFPLIKYFKFNLLHIKNLEYIYFFNNNALYILKLFNFKKRKFFFYNWYLNNLFYNRLYGLFFYFLSKEMNIFLKKKYTKLLLQLPFITLHKFNSRHLNIKVNYQTLFYLNNSKEFIYR